MRSINPTIEKINPTIPIPITSSPIPDEQREIIMAKSSIAIPNPIFFIVNPPLQMPICCHLHYTSLAIEKIAYFMKLVGWEQLATQGVPRWQVHKRVAGGSQRRGILRGFSKMIHALHTNYACQYPQKENINYILVNLHF